MVYYTLRTDLYIMLVKVLTRTLSEMSCYVINGYLTANQKHVSSKSFQPISLFGLFQVIVFLTCFQVENLLNENVDMIPNICMIWYAAVGNSWAAPTLNIMSKWPRGK